MAAPRKSSVQLAAREKALIKAQAMTARHEQLIGQAAEFFVYQDQAEQFQSVAQAKADALLAQADRDADGARLNAAKKVEEMLGTGESKTAVAARLGLSAVELKRLIDTLPAPTKAADRHDFPAQNFDEASDA